jgi:hypothetical protein
VAVNFFLFCARMQARVGMRRNNFGTNNLKRLRKGKNRILVFTVKYSNVHKYIFKDFEKGSSTTRYLKEF